jgi:hypothetical protein
MMRDLEVNFNVNILTVVETILIAIPFYLRCGVLRANERESDKHTIPSLDYNDIA